MTEKQFEEKYWAIKKLALEMSQKARADGFPSLADEEIYYHARDGRDVFACGIELLVDGMEKGFVEKVLTNLIDQEKDEDEIRLKIIQREAVFAIREGMHPDKLRILLNSYTHIPFNEDRSPEDRKMDTLDLDDELNLE